MAKKKRKPKATPQHRTHPHRNPELPISLFDPRLREKVIREFLGDLHQVESDPRRNQAEELLDRAYREPDDLRRLELAQRALQAWPDCADAYVLLAENTRNRKEALELYEQAVAAGERSLGPETWQESVGNFWLVLETRPYMRARLGLAQALWTLGRREEAVHHLEELLRLNPNDNQGVRYTLAAWLLNLDRDEHLSRLLAQFDEGTATWAYTKALLAFRRQGDTPPVRKLLKDAKRSNKYVAAFLLDEKPLPSCHPDYYGIGDENEAVIYAAAFLGAWKASPGAVDWLREVVKSRKRKRSETPPAEGPSPASTERLGRLPQKPDVWQADCRQFLQWVEVGGERVRPWIVLVTNRSDDLILGHTLFEEEPSADRLWDQLVEAMQQPLAGKPHRPSKLHVRTHERWEQLEDHLKQIGVECVPQEQLDQLDFIFEDLTTHMFGESQPGLLDMPGVGPQQAESFFAAAAGFYKKAPWRSLGFEAIIKVECEKFESSPWFGVVMGQSGMTFGLTLYDDLELLQELQSGDYTEEECARQTVALTVTFDEEGELAVDDLKSARQYGWEIAGPKAFPCIFRKEKGMSIRPPLAWELELMEACLRAVPEFVTRYKPDDPARLDLTVATASGKLPLALSWVQDE